MPWGSFVLSTSASQKADIDESVATMIFATNSSFRTVENPYFVQMAQKLRPGYTPPSRKDIADKWLTTVYDREYTKCEEVLKGKTVCLSTDGWSNVHNEPIICSTVTTADGSVYLVDTIDTSGTPHTAENLTELTTASIAKAEKDFKCSVGSVVTDNAANVAKMRTKLEESETHKGLITYGCSAHLLNLLAHDLEIPNVKAQVVYVVKYFRNNHFASAEYKKEKGNALIVPQDVRWNTMADCLGSYIDNWSSLMKICENNRDTIDKDIQGKVSNIGLKRTAEDLRERLKPIAKALDKAQSDSCKIGDAVDVWKEVEKTFATSSRDVKKKVKDRYDQAITPAHLLANLLDPKLRGKQLTEDEKETAMMYARKKWPFLLPVIMKYQAQSKPFSSYKFEDDVVKGVSSQEWWASHEGQISTESMNAIQQLLSSVASSAGVERIFSSYGLVQSKLRNRLGTDKAAKLVFLFRALNKNEDITSGDEEEEEKSVE